MAIRQSLGFGFIPEETKHHFLVVIPRSESESVTVYESFEWNEKLEKKSYDESRKKVIISREKWKHIKEPLQKEFNKRLKAQKLTVGKWTSGQVLVEKLFGKELVLLLWAVEDCDPTVIPTAIRNWLGLTKEERWWLFTMTNASTGHACDKRGWRKAVRFALTENPVEESATQRNIIEELFRQHAQN